MKSKIFIFTGLFLTLLATPVFAQFEFKGDLTGVEFKKNPEHYKWIKSISKHEIVKCKKEYFLANDLVDCINDVMNSAMSILVVSQGAIKMGYEKESYKIYNHCIKKWDAELKYIGGCISENLLFVMLSK